LETPHPEDLNQFRDGDDWYEVRTETVHIPVAGRDAPTAFTIRYTRNGPLISEKPPIALRWTAHDIGTLGIDAFLDLNLAEDWSQFNVVLDRLAAPSLNATYADVDGNIGFRTIGILPDRSQGVGLYPLQGDVPANRWRGTIAAEQMPRVLNPPCGFLAAANARVNAAGDGPLVSADNAAPYRIRRIQQILSADKLLSIDDMCRLQTDWHDGQAAHLLPHLLASIEAEKLAPSGKQALRLIEEWHSEPTASADSAAALVFQAWYLQIAREVFAAPLGEDFYQRLLKRNYVLNHALDALLLSDDATWWHGKKPVRLATALDQAVSDLTDRFGPDQAAWRLDHAQQLTLAHELGKAEPALAPLFNLSTHSFGGSPASVGRASYRYHRPFQVSHGATVRVAADMQAVPEVRAVMPSGQSGHPLSNHYADQFNAWLDGRHISVHATPSDVSGDILTLTPE
ncbi:MAG: penicillin acylase family protein, partial [Thermomicrobiales bacterium]